MIVILNTINVHLCNWSLRCLQSCSTRSEQIYSEYCPKCKTKQQSNCFLLRLKESDLRTFSPPSLPAHWTMKLGMESYQWAQHDRHSTFVVYPLKCLQESLLHARVACEVTCYLFFRSLEFLLCSLKNKWINWDLKTLRWNPWKRGTGKDSGYSRKILFMFRCYLSDT